jgi:hypothetical protein
LTYVVSDGKGGETTGTITVTVRDVNDAPVAFDDILGSVSTDKGSPQLNVLVNDTDVDSGDTMSVYQVATSDSGAFSTTATTALGNTVKVTNGKVTYTSDSVTNGPDSFAYQIVDSGGKTSIATASLTLSNNNNPNAVNDEQTIIEDALATEILVLSNDTDIDDADTPQIHEVNLDPVHGIVSIVNGKLFYTPNTNYVGTDSFTYIVRDGRSGFDEATATITITAVNDDPLAKDDEFTVESGSSATIVNLLGNDIDVDGDTLSVTAAGQTDSTSMRGGTVLLSGGVVTYAPEANFVGEDSFSYTVDDGQGGTATATVSITVSVVNRAPVAIEDGISTVINQTEDSVYTPITVLSNDTDADGDALSVVAVTQSEHGSVKISGRGIEYKPDANYNGIDSFSYTISDGNGETATAIVTITVSDDGTDVATAVADDLGDIILGSRAVKVDLTTNDVSGDSGVANIQSVAAAKYGTTAISDGEVYYTPGSVVGVDTFIYTLVGGETATAKVNVVAANSEATGSVVITGSAQTGQTLTVSNTLADADLMTTSTVTYQWYRDGDILQGETTTTHEITTEEVGAVFTVKASYIDDKGTTESVTSDSTDAVVQLDKAFSFVSSAITVSAAQAAYSNLLTEGDELVKLTLNLNIDSINSRSDITSITAADLNLTVVWTDFVALNDGASDAKFFINNISSDLLLLNSSSTSDSNSFDTLILASTRTNNPLLTIVDNDATNDSTGITTSVDLIEVFVKPSTSAGKLSIELNGTISANQGQVTLTQYDSTMSNINNVVGNSDPVGSVTVSGSVAVGSVLSATNNITDADGMPSSGVNYQWLRDTVAIGSENSDTYTLTASDINKDISVEATYLDLGTTPTTETVTSTPQTLTQSPIDKPLMFDSVMITAEQASLEKFGADKTDGSDEVIVKLTLEADMARFAVGSTVDSITGAELDISISGEVNGVITTDWSLLFDDIVYTDGTTAKFEYNKDYTGQSFIAPGTNSAGEIDKIIASSTNLSSNPILTLVDNTVTSGRGWTDIASKSDLISIYLNPKDGVKNFEVTFGGEIAVNQGDATFVQSSYQYEAEASSYDAIVSTSTTAATESTAATITKLTGDVTIDLLDADGVNAASIAVDTGEISIDNTVYFTDVKLSKADAYDFDIRIDDAIDVLKHIVSIETLASGSFQFHAADVNNDGQIRIDDAIDILKHIVSIETIDTFDVIDSDGNRITQLDASAQGAAPTWTLVANGDVNMSGGFDDAYVVTSEIV